MCGNQLTFDLRVKLQNDQRFAQTQSQKLRMDQIETDILKGIILEWIKKQLMKSNSNSTFYLVGFEVLNDYIQKRQNEVQIVFDSIQ